MGFVRGAGAGRDVEGRVGGLKPVKGERSASVRSTQSCTELFQAVAVLAKARRAALSLLAMLVWISESNREGSICNARRFYCANIRLRLSSFACAAAWAGPAPNALYVGFTTAGNSDIGMYPLTPQVVPFGKEFAPATDPQSFTIAGGKLYWIDGVQVLDANLDGSGLSVLDTFGIDPTSIAVNSAGGQLYVGFTTAGSNDIGVYPLTPEASGKKFAPATDPQSFTIAGGKLYWIDGVQVLDANLDGSGLSVLDTFGIGPTSIAVSVAPPTVPEASTWVMMLLGFAGLGLSGYRASQWRAAVAV